MLLKGFKRLNNAFVSFRWKQLIKIALDADKSNSFSLIQDSINCLGRENERLKQYNLPVPYASSRKGHN